MTTAAQVEPDYSLKNGPRAFPQALDLGVHHVPPTPGATMVFEPDEVRRHERRMADRPDGPLRAS